MGSGLGVGVRVRVRVRVTPNLLDLEDGRTGGGAHARFIEALAEAKLQLGSHLREGLEEVQLGSDLLGLGLGLGLASRGGAAGQSPVRVRVRVGVRVRVRVRG